MKHEYLGFLFRPCHFLLSDSQVHHSIFHECMLLFGSPSILYHLQPPKTSLTNYIMHNNRALLALKDPFAGCPRYECEWKRIG